MRIWIAGLCTALTAACGQQPETNQTPEPSATAIEAGLPTPGSATAATQQANADLAARLELPQGSDG